MFKINNFKVKILYLVIFISESENGYMLKMAC